MRQTLVVWAVLALVAGAMAQAADRSPAALVPADTAIYVEVNLGRLTGDAVEAAALRDVLGKSQLLTVARKLAEEDLQAAEVLENALRLAEGLAKVIGPRVGLAVSMDPAEMMGGGPPRVIVVADLKDEAALNTLLQEMLPKLDLPYVTADGELGASMQFVGSKAALTHARDWVAFGFPAEGVEEVRKLDLGQETASLAADLGFQRALKGLPEDAVVIEYISGRWLQQMSALGAMVAPEFTLPTPPEDGLAWAATLRVAQQEGRRMVTAAWTTDLDKALYMVEMPVVAALVPTLTRAREAARKTQCLSNVKNLAVAMNMFVADYDRFPKADQWVEALRDYVKNEGVYKCPEDKSDARCSYGMNWGLSRKPASTVEDTGRKVVIYETARPGANPMGGKTDVVSPPRHLGGNNYGFVDGHVKWCREPAPPEVDW